MFNCWAIEAAHIYCKAQANTILPNMWIEISKLLRSKWAIFYQIAIKFLKLWVEIAFAQLLLFFIFFIGGQLLLSPPSPILSTYGAAENISQCSSHQFNG